MRKYIVLIVFAMASLACVRSLPSGSPRSARQAAQPPSGSPTMTPAPVPIRRIPCARVVAGSLHIRFAPQYESNVEGWFTQDVILTVRNDSNPDWWLVNGHGIQFDGKKARITGYVRSSWLELVQCGNNVQTRNFRKRR